jgi:tetratricopeptide (TPR) repeat protein
MRSSIAVLLLMLVAGPTPANSAVILSGEQKCMGGNAISFEQAFAACNELIDSGTLHGRDLALHLVRRGSLLEDKKQYRRAIADFNAAVSIDPRYSSAPYNFRAQAYEAIGDFKHAIADYKAALVLVPNSQYYRTKLARAESKLAELAASRPNLVNAQRVDGPSSGELTKPAKPPPMAGRKQEVRQLRE